MSNTNSSAIDEVNLKIFRRLIRVGYKVVIILQDQFVSSQMTQSLT